MLVFTRKAGEKFVIGGNVIVTVFKTSSTQVRLGIEAPKGVTVDRMEVHEKRLDDTEVVEDSE